MSFKKKLFLILWLAGIAGVLSLLTIDVSALLAAMPVAPDTDELPRPVLLKLLTIIQPTILTTVAVLIGVLLAERVGLHSPAAEAAARGDGVIESLKPQVVPGVLAGIVSGFAIVLIWMLARPYFTDEFVRRAEKFNELVPPIVRFLYGGFTEEILLRWGLMTLLIWTAWRLLQRGKGQPRTAHYVAAIVLSALAFGAGHLPAASLLNDGLSLPIVLYVLTGNSVFGIVAGFLYWRRGLESAMIAHIFAHVVLIGVGYLELS